MAKKQRLDIFMVEEGLVPSRSSAQAMIMAGEVFVNGQKAAKAGEGVAGDTKQIFAVCQPRRIKAG